MTNFPDYLTLMAIARSEWRERQRTEVRDRPSKPSLRERVRLARFRWTLGPTRPEPVTPPLRGYPFSQ